jgi:glutamine---fructose-6-phosphate transaminase (isomerizing)
MRPLFFRNEHIAIDGEREGAMALSFQYFVYRRIKRKMEGALKLKETAYIHAEAYASGELKYGPLALIDAHMPIIVVAPNNDLLKKLKSNVEEVRARGDILYVFADVDAKFESDATMRVINVPHIHP